MKKMCFFIVTTVALVSCSPSDADFAHACKTTARIEIKDAPRWRDYLAESKAVARPPGAKKAYEIVTLTDSYVVEGKRFESGRRLAKNVFSKDESQIREKATGNIIAVAHTLEWLSPRFGHSIQKNCIREYPKYYIPYTRASL